MFFFFLREKVSPEALASSQASSLPLDALGARKDMERLQLHWKSEVIEELKAPGRNQSCDHWQVKLFDLYSADWSLIDSL